MCLFWILSNKLDLNQETHFTIIGLFKQTEGGGGRGARYGTVLLHVFLLLFANYLSLSKCTWEREGKFTAKVLPKWETSSSGKFHKHFAHITYGPGKIIFTTVHYMYATMHCFQNEPAYFDKAVNHAQTVFIKSTPGLNVIKERVKLLQRFFTNGGLQAVVNFINILRT
jgi:hypothetical protein